MFKIALAVALFAVALADVNQFYRPGFPAPARKVGRPTYQYKPAAPIRPAVPKYAPVRTPSYAPARTPSYAPARPAIPNYAPYQGSRVAAAPAGILRQDSNIQPDGSYSYHYETDNGIQAQEQGSIHQVGRELATGAQGSYSYFSPEGEQISVSYVADENGFQPQGTYISDAIQRSLAYNRAHPEQETVRVGYNNKRKYY